MLCIRKCRVPYMQKYQRSGLPLTHLDWKELQKLLGSWTLPVSSSVGLTCQMIALAHYCHQLCVRVHSLLKANFQPDLNSMQSHDKINIIGIHDNYQRSSLAFSRVCSNLEWWDGCACCCLLLSLQPMPKEPLILQRCRKRLSS